MDELEPIRELVWQRRIKLIRDEAKRYRRWMVWCAIFTPLVFIIAVLAKAAVFFVVAAFFAFFTWNRWMEWRRTKRWLLGAANQQSRAEWVEKFWQEALIPPAWEKVSNWVAVMTLVCLYGLIQILDFITSGTVTRIWFGVVNSLLLVILWGGWRMRNRIRRQQESLRNGWDELT